MKKLVSIFIITAIMCTMSGCTMTSTKNENTTSTNISTKPSSSEAEEIPQKLYSLGDTIEIGNFQITANSVEVTDRVASPISETVGFKPEDGSKYVVIDTTVKNIGTDNNTFLPVVGTVKKDISVKLVFGDYEFKSTNLLGHSDDLHTTSLNPLSSKTGFIAFQVADEVAQDLSDVKLVFSLDKDNYEYSLAKQAE
ncbi:MAG: DUF4352 domain-containing protein [Ruminiclostridium sp.]|nr:DUF4352 domain-containing protein [Ruminiclostridium sp.]